MNRSRESTGLPRIHTSGWSPFGPVRPREASSPVVAGCHEGGSATSESVETSAKTRHWTRPHRKLAMLRFPHEPRLVRCRRKWGSRPSEDASRALESRDSTVRARSDSTVSPVFSAIASVRSDRISWKPSFSGAAIASPRTRGIVPSEIRRLAPHVGGATRLGRIDVESSVWPYEYRCGCTRAASHG
jgi:hypothetical protein